MSNTLTITFLGHQSWAISTDIACVLIDPVLTEAFGYCDDVRFTVYPRRKVITHDLPRIDAVVLSNEHLDHFHLPSLALLDRSIPIIIGAIAPSVVSNALCEYGFENVVRLVHGDRYAIGDLSVQMIAVAPESPKWEHRVHSVHVRAENDPGVLIQSDGALAYDELDAADIRPRTLIATNNAQIPIELGNSAFANLLGDSTPATMEGLRVVRSVIDEPASRLRSVDTVLLSGAGYTYDDGDAPLFRWNDQKALASAISRLSLAVHVVGLLPGECVLPNGSTATVDWIRLTERSDPTARLSHTRRPRHLNATPIAAHDHIDRVIKGLRWLEPLLINSTLGSVMLGVNDYLGKLVGPVRFYLHLRGTYDDFIGLEFDLTTSQFRPSALTLRAAMLSVPFGIDVYLDDFLDVLEGRRQIWELCTASLAQWYDSERMESPVAFLYEMFSEQVRPDLAARLIRDGMRVHA